MALSLDFSLSLQISRRANKPLRSVSEQTELREGGGGSERLQALGLVCVQRFAFFFVVVLFFSPTYSWGSISVHFC